MMRIMPRQGLQPEYAQIICPATDDNPRNSEATAVLLENGDILLAWSRFKNLNRGSAKQAPGQRNDSGLPGTDLESDNARAEIAGMLSSDQGNTWGNQRVLVENTAGLNVMSPALRRLKDGGLGMVYSFRESSSTAYRLFRRSDDEGETWSEPVTITPGGYMTGTHDRLMVLESGRIIAPLHCTDDWHSHYLYTRIARSDDNGGSWQIGEPIRLPKVTGSGESGCWEPDVEQRADGSLLLIMRTAMGTIFRAESQDEGETWEGLRSMEVVSPVAPAVLRRIPKSDTLLLIWNWHYDWREAMAGVRRPLALALSHDGGDSWAERYILEDDPAFTYAYPSCLFLPDQALITYYVSRTDDPYGARSLKMMRIPLDDLLKKENG